MKLSALAYLATAFSASLVLADEPQLEPTPTVSAEDNYTTTPPEVALKEYLEHGNNLELRQAGLNLNGEATTAATQAGATTTFYMASAIGTTDTWVAFTYVQTFAAVPDQWPSPVAGEIGLGTLVKQNKRDAAPTPAGSGSGQPLVLAMQNVVVTQPVHAVMEVTEMVEIPPGWTNGSQISNHTTPSLNQTAPLSTGNMTSAANVTAPANMTVPGNITAPGNMTAAVNVTRTHSVRILPSQMNPAFMHPPLATAP